MDIKTILFKDKQGNTCAIQDWVTPALYLDMLNDDLLVADVAKKKCSYCPKFFICFPIMHYQSIYFVN